MISASELRMKARELDRAASELEGIERTIKFLNDHPDLNPVIEVNFHGHLDDGQKAADFLETYFSSLWSNETALEHFRKARDKLKGQFK